MEVHLITDTIAVAFQRTNFLQAVKTDFRLHYGALKSHFLTTRRKSRQIESGQRSQVLQSERRRQRIAEKLRRRIDMLNRTTTWAEADKIEFKKGMQMNCMSPENSEQEDNEDQSASENSETEEEGGRHRRSPKIIKVHPLSWRSSRFQSLLDSLDRKYRRKISDKARTMIKQRQVGEAIVCEAPGDLPAWMVNKE